MSFNEFSSTEFLNGANTNRSDNLVDKSNASTAGSVLPLPWVTNSMINTPNQSPTTARIYQRAKKIPID